MFDKFRKNLAYRLYGKEFVEQMQDSYDKSKRVNDNNANLKAKALSYKQNIDAMTQNMIEYTERIDEIEDAYYKIQCKTSKEVLAFETLLIKHNERYWNNATHPEYQGQEYLGSLEVSKTFREHGLFPLFNRYDIKTLYDFFDEIGIQEESHPILTIVYLFLHQERLRDEDISIFEHNTIDRVKKIKNMKCDTE